MDDKEFDLNPLDSLKMKLRQGIYYFIVFLVSLVILVVAPMIDPQQQTQFFQLIQQDSVGGWIAYIAIRIAICVLNVFIYACFVRQGELNTFEHPNKIEADKILGKYKIKELKPKSPRVFRAKMYGGKSISIILTNALALVALPPLVFYDWRMAITYASTIVTSIGFGIYNMKVVEAYWSSEYLRFALYIEKELAEKEKETSQISSVQAFPEESNINIQEDTENPLKPIVHGCTDIIIKEI